MKTTVEESYEARNLQGEKEQVILTFTQFSPKEGMKVAIRMSKILSGPLGKLFQNLKKVNDTGSSLDDFDISSLGSAIESLFDRIDEDVAIDTMEILLKPVLKGNKPLSLDDLMFQGNPMLPMKICIKSAEVNFSDFFDATSGVLNRLKEKVKSQVSSQM